MWAKLLNLFSCDKYNFPSERNSGFVKAGKQIMHMKKKGENKKSWFKIKEHSYCDLVGGAHKAVEVCGILPQFAWIMLVYNTISTAAVETMDP